MAQVEGEAKEAEHVSLDLFLLQDYKSIPDDDFLSGAGIWRCERRGRADVPQYTINYLYLYI